MRRVERRLKAALGDIALPAPGGVEFTLDAPTSGAVSVTDLLVRFLELPVHDWNVAVVITRIAAVR